MTSTEEGFARLVREHWSYQLVRELEDESFHLKSTDKSIAIRDLHPKARVLEDFGLEKKQFNFGYHLKPHMKRLHMHVISKDFVSPSLKRRHHWTIFNSEIFQSHEAVFAELKLHGKIRERPDSYIKALREGPLNCAVCGYVTDKLCIMKQHIAVHEYSTVETVVAESRSNHLSHSGHAL
uniref:Aprataxin C2HE/C2H2/C2HC zinc finger domain-containing protein n=1 Tax=Anopheles epiroticus TaxID=199890 RepID=A0A182PNK9_9DIPT